MRSNSMFQGRALRRTALAVALGATLASGAAIAQSNSAGVIFGRAESGSTIHIENLDTGLSRDITPEADGRYRASSLPVGRYKVDVLRNGATVNSRSDVRVNVGQGTDVTFAAASSDTSAQNLEGVNVVANALPAIDVSTVDSRRVLTSEQLQKLPVARNVNAAVLLAPGAVAGDSRYGNVVSLGGSSAAENQYYINGYAVTNPLTGLGFTSLPFDAIDQEQVFYGGYGADFGRSTGGVVNIITKRGGNEWKAGAEVFWTPSSTRATPRAVYQKDGELVFDRSRNQQPWQTQYGAYISGPLVKDKLFLYATGEWTKSKQTTISDISDSGNKNYFEDKATRWMAKLDWNITDSNIIELTGIGDQSQEDQLIREYNYSAGAVGAKTGTVRKKNADDLASAAPGGTVYVGKYTGYLTDNLTLTALYGRSTTDHINSPLSASGVPCPVVSDGRASVPVNERVNGCFLNGSQLVDGANDRTHGFRIELEWHLGSHDIRGGVDNQTLESFNGTEDEGGQRYQYFDTPASGLIRNGTLAVPAGNPYYVNQGLFAAAAKVRVEQEAQYLEDHWQVTDRWMAYVGLRNEQFKNFNGDGDVYVKQRHQLAPRLGATWDVFGDSTFKVYANAGRYHLAIPSNVAIRGASGSTFYTQYGTFTGIDPTTGAPIGYTPIEDKVYSNGENGVAPDPRSVAARNLQAYYQDEYILGFDKTIGSDWTFGAKLTMRKLKSIIDDMCDARPFIKWADDHGVDSSGIGYNCYLFNPGRSNTFTIDLDGDGSLETVDLSKKDLGFPELKRKYYSMNLYLEHQFNDNWYGRVDYTLSRSYGNSEGLLKSDIGQIDPSVTQDWDFPELMQGSNGPEANDRTHVVRALGYYQITPEWQVGGVLNVASGRPKNCIGNYPNEIPEELSNYGASYFYCNGQLNRRGSAGRLPWTETLDLNVRWTPAFANHQLAFTADVFNVFNQQRTLSIDETGEAGAVGVPNPSYQQPLSFSTPRYLQVGVRYDFSL